MHRYRVEMFDESNDVLICTRDFQFRSEADTYSKNVSTLKGILAKVKVREGDQMETYELIAIGTTIAFWLVVYLIYKST